MFQDDKIVGEMKVGEKTVQLDNGLPTRCIVAAPQRGGGFVTERFTVCRIDVQQAAGAVGHVPQMRQQCAVVRDLDIRIGCATIADAVDELSQMCCITAHIGDGLDLVVVVVVEHVALSHHDESSFGSVETDSDGGVVQSHR